MPLRRVLRASVPESLLASVAREVSARHGGTTATYECLEADNWLSIPCVVNEQWFVKVVTDQHAIVHGLLTAGRNIGVFSSGTEGFFEHFSSPIAMAEHELHATRRMQELGVNAPEPIEAFEHDGAGVVVLEYLPNFRTLDGLSSRTVEHYAPAVFANLSMMHEAGLAHGDLRSENVLVAPDDAGINQVYFIDATRVRTEATDDATAYDLACALASLAPLIGAHTAVTAAREHYATPELLAAQRFLDFVKLRPDHDFDAALMKGEIEKAASA